MIFMEESCLIMLSFLLSIKKERKKKAGGKKNKAHQKTEEGELMGIRGVA